MSRHNPRRTPFLTAFAGLAMAAVLIGQTQTATVRGTITDSSGAVFPKALLVLTNVDQNRPWKTVSNDAGEYTFVQIPPGNYRMTVEAPGFKKMEREGITLEVAQVLGLDAHLEIGNVTETVQVRGQVPLLDTASSSLGEVVNSRTTESLPLNGRNVLQLIALAPGINSTPGYRTQTDSNGTTNGPAFSANGGRNLSNTILVDGSPKR